MKSTKSGEEMATSEELLKNDKSKWVPLPADENIYRANLAMLSRFSPSLIVDLKDQPDIEIPVEQSISIKGVKNPICTVVIGFSGRTLVDKFLNDTKKECKHLVIIEPDYAVFNSTMKRVYLGDLFTNPRVDMIVGAGLDVVRPQLFGVFTSAHPKYGSRVSTCQTPEVVTDPFVYSKEGVKDFDEAEAFINAVIDTSKQVFLSCGCSADTYNRYEQTVRNLQNIKNSYEIKHLFDKFKGKPAIVVGAGPSMESFVNNCKEYNLQVKALIIACDASLKRLLKENIRPHIVTRCERKLSTIFEGVEEYDLKGIYYAAYPWCPPEYFDLFPDCFMLFRDNGVCKWTGYDPGSVNGGVSSANAALELAFSFGCSDIILTGIDLCMIGGQTHVGGTEVEFDPNKSKKEGKWSEIKGNTLEKVTTIPVWFRCLQEYAQAVSKWKAKGVNFNIYNTSTEGAEIPGVPYTEWSTALAKLEQDIDCTNIIDLHLKRPTREYVNQSRLNCRDTVSKLKSFLNDTKKLLLFLEDAVINCAREEEKVMLQIKGSASVKDFFSQSEMSKKSLVGMYKAQCSQIDSHKEKYFSDRMFTDTLIDLCQLETFQMENKINSLKNVVPIEYDRMKAYITLHHQIFGLYGFYASKLIKIMQEGWIDEKPLEQIDFHNDFIDERYKGARA